MHCPNCGIQTSIEQKFCRSCGMSLTVVAEAMVAHQAAAGSDMPLVENDKRALRRMGFGLFWGIVMLFIGAGVLGVNKRLFHGDLVWLLGLIMVLAGTIGSAYAVISPLWQQRTKPRKATGDQRSTGLEGSIQTLPEGLPAPLPSITEQTTTRLEHEAAKTLSGDSSKTTGA
jgi:hypothetical protein